jgi:hypothetical protein
MKVAYIAGGTLEVNGREVAELSDEQLAGLIAWVMQDGEWSEVERERLRRAMRRYLGTLTTVLGNVSGYQAYELILPDNHYLYSLLRDAGSVTFEQ